MNLTAGLRARLTQSLRSTWVLDCLASIVLVAWYYRYGIGHLRDHLYDTVDQKAMIYLLEWLHHSLFGSGHVSEVFDINMLYPNKNVLAWSETMLGFVPAYSLVRLVTRNPILALNVVAVLSSVVATLGMLRLGRELTGGFSIIAGAAGAVGLLVASQEGHLQLKALCLLVWSLLLLVRLVRGSGRALPWLIAVLSWLFLCSIYYAIMMAVFMVSATALALVLGRRGFLLWIQATLRRVPLLATALALGVSLIPVAWVGSHFLQVKKQFGGYDLDMFVPYSARLGSLLDAPATSLVYRSAYNDWGSHEARLCFGVLVWVGVALLAAGWRRWPRIALDREIVGVLGFGALLAIVLALGPFERYSLERGVHLPLPAYLFARFFPGFSALRTIGRFGGFAAVFMALLAEMGIRNMVGLVASEPGKTKLAYGAMAALCILEQTTVLTPQRVELIPRRPVYDAISRFTPPSAVVLELPVAKAEHWANISWWHEQMLGSTMHWRRIPVGFTSQESGALGRLVESYRQLEARARTPSMFLDDVREVGITHVVLNGDLMAAELATRLRGEFIAKGLADTVVSPGVAIFDCRLGAASSAPPGPKIAAPATR